VSGVALVLLTARHARNIERHACPGATALVERARQAAADAPSEVRAEFARLELDLIRDEATRTLAVATLLPRGVARIALATGTAFAVLCFARSANDGLAVATLGALAAFMAGGVSSAIAAGFGRRARDRAQNFRSDWKRALKLAERELIESGDPGTPLDPVRFTDV
jgi:hypothetical protein